MKKTIITMSLLTTTILLSACSAKRTSWTEEWRDPEVISYEKKASPKDSNKDFSWANNKPVEIFKDYSTPTPKTDIKPQKKPLPQWIIEENRDLKEVLDEWSRKAGWRLIWDSNRSYNISSTAVFKGDFKQAVTSVVNAMRRATPPLKANFYNGNRTLVITSIEDNNDV